MVGKLVIPMITPHLRNSLDVEGLRALISYAKTNKFDGLFAASSTGGCASFSYRQHYRVLRAVFNESSGLAMFANISRNNMEETLEMLHDAEDLGYDRFVSINPYYHKYSEESMERYFSSLAEGTSGKLYLYNNPQLSGNTISPELTARLRAKYSNITGIKDSGGDLDAFRKFTAIEGLEVYQGKDHLLEESLRFGATGGVCSTSNFSLNILRIAHEEGNIQESKDKVKRIMEIMKTQEVPAFHNYMFRLFVLNESKPEGYMNAPFGDLKEPPKYEDLVDIV